jgi:signal transduction histidine kinase
MVRSAKLTTVGQLAAGIAHEIRNPLSAIRMMVQVLQRKYERDTDCKEVHIILNEIERINKLVKDLLEYSKPSPMNFSKQNINDLVKNVLGIFTYNMQHQHIQVRERLGEDLPSVTVDPEKMSLVLINLIMNAIQAMPEGGTLTVETEKGKKQTLSIAVFDTGVGIPEENLKNVFEPFFTTKEEGTGLGLPLVKMIVERHGGKVRVASADGSTRIHIILPLAPSPPIPIV